MAWLKAGDTAAMDERVLRVAEFTDADDRSVNEVFGFVMRLYLQAAQQETDYQAAMGTAMVLSSRHEALLDQAQRAGLLTLGEEDGRRVIHLTNDAEFLHMRSREEILWERERKADIADPNLTVPVRMRDGDACRYCGCVVAFGMRKGGRGGTYDHLIPGQRARDEHELVVACRSCNSGRGEAEGDRDARFPLMPPPSAPYYSSSTRSWLEKHGTILTQLGLTVPKRPRGQKDLKPGTQTRDDVANAATAPSGDQRPTAPTARTVHAATTPSGDQRAATRRDANAGPNGGEPRRAGRDSEGTAPATPATAGRTRPGAPSEPRNAATGAEQMGSQRTSNPWITSPDASSADFPEDEGTGSGFPGTGRDGTGRAGPGRAGTAWDGGPPQAGPGRRRGRRGRRGKGA